MGARTTYRSKASSRRASKDMGSRMVELPAEAFDQTGEAAADAGRGHPELRGDLGGVQAGDEAQGEERAIVGLEAGQRAGKVHGRDPVRRVGPRRRVEGLADVDDDPAAALP